MTHELKHVIAGLCNKVTKYSTNKNIYTISIQPSTSILTIGSSGMNKSPLQLNPCSNTSAGLNAPINT